MKLLKSLKAQITLTLVFFIVIAIMITGIFSNSTLSNTVKTIGDETAQVFEDSMIDTTLKATEEVNAQWIINMNRLKSFHL